MKTVAWLAGVGTLISGAAYMVVSLNRWEWNRALFFGLIVLVAEVGLGTALVLRKLGQVLGHAATDPALDTLRSTRPQPPDRFEWLRDAARGQLNVFITFLVGGGVLLSGAAWLVDQLASRTARPIGEHRLASKLGLISYPDGGLVVDDVAVLAQETPGADDADPQALGPSGPRPAVMKLGRLLLGTVGLAIGVLGTIALREATLSTHEPDEPGSTVDLVVSARSEGAERGQTLTELVHALVLTCRLEVTADLTSPVHDEGTGRFRVTLAPALDETDRRQMRGCLEDWTIDQLLVDVVGFEAPGDETGSESEP